MPNGHLTLFRNEYTGGIAIHTDLLNERPCVLSRERAKKIGQLKQDAMEDKSGVEGCRFCHPEKLVGNPLIKPICDGMVGAFENATPYLPADHHVLFVRHPSEAKITEDCFHIYRLDQIRKLEFYLLLKGIVDLGKDFAKEELTHTDLPRMIVGFNIGPLAGQSQAHIHAQYGWEIVLDKTNISSKALDLYFEELQQEDLVIHSSLGDKDSRFMLVAPWTPKGQFALDLYFRDKFEIHKLSEVDIKIFAHVAEKIIRKYVERGICNINIVFSSSPLSRRITPVTVHFIPRVNMAALYEGLGRDVVDTPPSTIYNEFRSLIQNWDEEVAIIRQYDSQSDYSNKIEERKRIELLKESEIPFNNVNNSQSESTELNVNQST